MRSLRVSAPCQSLYLPPISVPEPPPEYKHPTQFAHSTLRAYALERSRMPLRKRNDVDAVPCEHGPDMTLYLEAAMEIDELPTGRQAEGDRTSPRLQAQAAAPVLSHLYSRAAFDAARRLLHVVNQPEIGVRPCDRCPYNERKAVRLYQDTHTRCRPPGPRRPLTVHRRSD